MSQLISTQAVLAQYEQLAALIGQNLQSLPQDFQEKFKSWESQSTPIITNYTLENPTTSSTSSQTNLTSLLIKERLKPHELQKLKMQGTAVHEANAIALITEYLLKTLSDPSTRLPIPPHSTSPIGPDQQSLAAASFNWTNLGLRKSKNLKSTIVFAMAGFLRVANEYLRQNPLYTISTAMEGQGEDDSNKIPINAQFLANYWTTSLIPLIQDDVKTLQNNDGAANQWNYVTVEFPTTDERKGNVDFYFDLKAYTSALKTLSDAQQRDVKADDKEVMNKNGKRKDVPASSSPVLVSQPASKQKLSNENDTMDDSDDKTVDNQLVSLDGAADGVKDQDETKVYREIAGLFDFAPTTGESRHCIDPNTKDLQQFQFTAMGYINSCYRAKFSTPRQGNAAPSSHASLTLHNDVRFHSVLGLEQYSHVWVLFVFHSNAQGSYRPKITPPRLGERVGCLATRSPHRWNDIGLSLVKLDRIEYPEDFAHLPVNHPSRQFVVHSPGVSSKAKNLPGCARLILSNVDLIDGTPIIDVKPFNPGDIIPDPKSLRLPPWLADAPMYTLQIHFHQQAMDDLYTIFKQYYSKNHSQLVEKATIFNQGIESNDVKIKSMDKTTFSIYSRLYQSDRVQKIGRYVKYFDVFDTSIVSIDQAATMTVGGDQDGAMGSDNLVSRDQEGAADPLLSRDQIQDYLTYELGGPLQFYPTISSIKQAIVDTLRNDPRPIWTKFENRNRAIFGFLYDNLNIVYQMNGDTEATVCFLQHRDEYMAMCEQVKDSQKEKGDAGKVVDLKKDLNNSNKGDAKEMLEKRGWVQLIKDKITRTTVDPTDDWAKQIHREAAAQGK